MRKILFVCTANICRSPMAEAIFNALAEDGGLPFYAESAGVSALEGRPMAEKSRTVLLELGIEPGSHWARQVSGEAVEEAELTLAMTGEHVAYLQKMCRDPAKILSLTEYAAGDLCWEKITDPYGGSTTAYRASAHQLLRYLEPAIERLSQIAVRSCPRAGHVCSR